MEESRITKISMVIISTAIIVTILRELRAIFIPLTFAFFLTLLLAPINRFFYKKGIPKFIVLLIAVILIFVILTLSGTLIYTGVSSFVTEFPKYEQKMINMGQDLIFKYEIPMDDVRNYVKNNVNLNTMIDKFSIPQFISSSMGNFVDFLFKLIMTIIFMLFIISGREKTKDRFLKSMTDEGVSHSSHIYFKIETQVITFLISKTVISLGTALIAMFFIGIFRIDFVIISGLLTFVLNYIPNFGSILASLFPIIICFFEYGISWQLFAISIILLVVQFTIGNVVEPKLMGNQLNLSPIIILIALIFWAWVWGPVGMILAVPLTSALNIILKDFKSMKFVSAIMSDD